MTIIASLRDRVVHEASCIGPDCACSARIIIEKDSSSVLLGVASWRSGDEFLEKCLVLLYDGRIVLDFERYATPHLSRFRIVA